MTRHHLGNPGSRRFESMREWLKMRPVKAFEIAVAAVAMIAASEHSGWAAQFLVSDRAGGLFILDGQTGQAVAAPASAITRPIASAMLDSNRAIVLSDVFDVPARRIDLSSGDTSSAVDPSLLNNPVSLATRPDESALILNAGGVLANSDFEAGSIIAVSPLGDAQVIFSGLDTSRLFLSSLALTSQGQLLFTNSPTRPALAPPNGRRAELNRLEPTGAVSTLYSFPNDGFECADPPPGDLLDFPIGIATHWSGRIYVGVLEVRCFVATVGGTSVEFATVEDSRIVRIDPSNGFSAATIWRGDGVSGPAQPDQIESLTLDADGSLIVADAGSYTTTTSNPTDGNIYRLTCDDASLSCVVTRISNDGQLRDPTHAIRMPEPAPATGILFGTAALCAMTRARRNERRLAVDGD